MEIERLKRRLATALEAHGEVELALLFGSRARGEARPGSEVDVAVVGGAIDTIGLAIELTDALGIQVDANASANWLTCLTLKLIFMLNIN